MAGLQKYHEAANISSEVSPCLWFQPTNLTGQYDLELEKPSHFAVAEGCLLINAWEAEVSRALDFPDVSQRGNVVMKIMEATLIYQPLFLSSALAKGSCSVAPPGSI